MGRLSIRLVALGAGFFVSACATTVLKDSWRNPEAGPIQFQKVVVLALTKDAALRQSAEDELVRRIGRGEAIAAYTFIPDAALGDTAKLKQLVKAQDFDGAVVFRILGSDKRQTYMPGQYMVANQGLWGYYAYAYPLTVNPGYAVTETYVEVETRVYSVADERLVWAARSETANPQSVGALVDGVAGAAVKELRAQGLLP